ncbi:MAG: DUF6134 family protein [Parvularculaceae bacterium]|nr:DUF6134 family protein [Parvularculaceae bacterium]
MKLSLSFFAALASSLASASASELDAAFDIIRKGDRIGFHAVNVEETADGGTRVETRIEMQVKIGPIPVFNYEHLSTETWRDGLLQTVESRTDNNGNEETLSVRREGEALIVDGTRYQGPGPGDAVPSSYWNKAIVSTKTLLDTQNGRLIDVKIENLGQTASPTGVRAEQHKLTGTVDLNLWYDGARWVGADFIVRGQALTYSLVDSQKQAQLFAKLNLSAGR